MVVRNSASTQNPLALFDRWLFEAREHPDIKEPNAMSLATANQLGQVSCRVVLLKEYSARGFVFYTNHATSRKSLDIQANPYAALCFYWMKLDKQVRIEGTVTKVSDAQADAYFASRSRGSQIGAWASHQSETLDSRTTLDERIKALEMQYSMKEDIPRPPHWHGWCVEPQMIEFWEQRDFRLHDRLIFTKQADGSWADEWLNP